MKDKGQKEVLDKTDLVGLEEWSGNMQNEDQEFITQYASIFAISDMDLGKTSLVKHSIRLTDNTHLRSNIDGYHAVCMKKLGDI